MSKTWVICSTYLKICMNTRKTHTKNVLVPAGYLINLLKQTSYIFTVFGHGAHAIKVAP